jgi:serine phosphatase RsbU (regulator of sigma subunit)
VPLRFLSMQLDKSAGPLRRAIQYAFYDFTREMPRTKRIITWVAILIQGYAIYALAVRSFVWPLMWPSPIYVFIGSTVVFYAAYTLMNGMLTSELVRKSQLEFDQMAARKIQQTLIPQALEPLPGYEMKTFYQPFRDVGGDYFDVIDLPNGRTLLAVADVSSKGMAAALLAANIQALVRSIANVEAEPLALARQINQHLSRYTPTESFATAVFLLLHRSSGELTYVNAGHNQPILFADGAVKLLEPTGMPLGLFGDAKYEAKTATLGSGDSLLLFTDGLTDSIAGADPEARLRTAFADSVGKTMSNLESLVDAKFRQDDVTILLVKRDSALSPPHQGIGEGHVSF